MNNIFILLLLVLFFQTSQAYVGAVSTATGQSGRAAVEPVDGILLNPAVISELPKKNMSINYSNDDWAITISDNGEDSYFPAALQFRKATTDLLDTQNISLGIGTAKWNNISLGFMANMYEYTYKPTGLTEEKYRQATLDIGLIAAFSENFGIGLVTKKVAAGKIDLNDALQTPQTISAGLSYTYETFARFRADVESAPGNKTDKLIYMAGMENYINEWIVIRIGYQNNNVVAKNYYSAGLGFAGPQFGLHYAYISNTNDKTDSKHLIDLVMAF